jgi:hypothetical protein
MCVNELREKSLINKMTRPGLPGGAFPNQKTQILENSGGTCNRRCLFILYQFGIFYGHLPYFMDICHILWTFAIFYGHLLHIFGGYLVFFHILVCL